MEMSHMIRALLFDFDLILGDPTDGIVLSIDHALKRSGHATPDIADIKKTMGSSLKETYFALTSDDDPDRAERSAKLFKEKADDVMVDHTELYAGVKTVLQDLKAKGYKTAIVTTKFHYRIDQILKKYDAEELIDIIVGAEDVKIEKPDPEGVLLAIKYLGVMKEEVLYVGDSLVDAKTAENAEVRFAAVRTGTTTRDDFRDHESVYIGKDIADVCNYVLTLG